MDQHARAAEIIAALRAALHDESGTAEECVRRAASILAAAERSIDPTSTSYSGLGLAPWQVRRVTAYVDAHLATPIRNSDLAGIARLSVCHFNRAFRKSTGHPPHAYIIRRRMTRASQLMLSTDSPLSQIAAECGLSDQSHFTRLFRRVIGESPGAWRRATASPQS